MAEEIKVIRVGDILTNLIDPVSKLSVQYSKTLLWYDGTSMTDGKLDSYGIYVKKDDEYFLKSLGEYGQVLQKNTMSEMRAMSGLEIFLLQIGYYNSVQLNGYYEDGDTPNSIQYFLSNTTEDDDGGSVIQVSEIKLEHEFKGKINPKYFGTRLDEDNALIFNHIINYLEKDVEITEDTTINPSTIYNGKRGIVMKSDSQITSPNGSYLISLPTSVGSYSVIHVEDVNNVIIDGLNIIGDRDDHDGTTGEWGMGINIVGSSNVKVTNVNISKCWGDGIYIGATSNNTRCNNINLSKIDIDDCRRQGVSVISVDGLYLRDLTMSNIRGTNPQAGIDFEPNLNTSVLKNIFISNVKTTNCAYSVLFAESHLSGSLELHDINIDGLSSVGDDIGIYIGGVAGFGSLEERIYGKISLTNLLIENSGSSGIFIRNYENRLDLSISNVTIKNPSSGSETTYLGSGLVITKEPQDVDREGVYIPKIEIQNISVLDDRGAPLMYNGIYIRDRRASGTRKHFKNIYLNVSHVDPARVNRITYFAEGGFSSLKPIIQTVSEANQRITPYEMVTDIEQAPGASGATATIYNFPKDTVLRITMKTGLSFGLRFNVEPGSVVGFPESNNSNLTSASVGNFIELKCIDSDTNTWAVEKIRGRFTAGIGSSSNAYDSMPSRASSSLRGIVYQTASQGDITLPNLNTLTADEVSAVVSWINNNLIPLVNAIKSSQNTELQNQRDANQQAP